MLRSLKSNRPLEESFFNLNRNETVKPYTEITGDVHVTIWPEFINNKSSVIDELFIWAYHVRIDNKSPESLQLINRYWKIIDEKGTVQEVNGEGVIGEQPTIPANGSYQYSSGVHLRYPSGIMMGHYQMKKSDGSLFNVIIPTFSLDIPNNKGALN